MLNRYLLRNILIIDVFFMLTWLGYNSSDKSVITFRLINFIFIIIYSYWLISTFKLKPNKKLRQIYTFMSSKNEFVLWIISALFSYLKLFIFSLVILFLLFDYFQFSTNQSFYFICLIEAQILPFYLITDLFLHMKRYPS